MNKKGVFEEGEEVDFDQLNEQYLTNLTTYDTIKALNADIETKNFSALKAYETFSTIDRNLRIQREVADKEITETPKEKFERIQREFQELQQELTSETEHNQNSQIPLILREVENLQNELSNIIVTHDLKRVLDAETLETLQADLYVQILKSNLSNNQTELFLAQLKELQKQEEDAKNVSYKINLNNVSEKVRKELKIADLQRRIDNIERILGHSGTDVVNEGIKKLKGLTELLLKPCLDSITGKIIYASQQLDRVGMKKESMSINDLKLSDIEKSYDSYAQVENTIEQLPQIIGRLESLQTIHEESAKIVNKVTHLTDNQTAALQNLEENQELVKKMETIFGQNLEVMKENLASLKTRIDKLKR